MSRHDDKSRMAGRFRAALRSKSADFGQKLFVLSFLFFPRFIFCASVPGGDLFTNNPIPHLQVEIAPEQAAKLRQDSRADVAAIVKEGTNVYDRVAIHLKGSTGSFRPLDAKPGLTLNFSKFAPSQKFHGLEKIHLNNSVEDVTYLNEYIGGILFRNAGVPAPRVAHALVTLNSKSLGLYVLKEGWTADFLSLYFKDTQGNLYDTVKPSAGHSSAHDVDQPLARDSGKGAEDRSDLKALAAAANERDPTRRWKLLEQTLDMDRFITFMAMEVMVGHRDGYCLARNNFRVYHDLDSFKIQFFPHGMDQLFGKADNPYKPFMSGLVAKAVMETPEGGRLYKLRFGILFSNVFDVPAIHREIDRKLAQIRPALRSREFRTLQNEATILKTRIASRHAHLLQQLLTPELQPVAFTEGVAVLKDWRPVDEPPGGKIDKTPAPDGKAALHIRAGPVTGASWRSRVILKRGRYRFVGLIQTAGVEPLSFGKMQGAALRVVGRPRSEGESVVGTSGWKKVQYQFEIAEPTRELELICELRARSGQAWFAIDSLRLLSVP